MTATEPFRFRTASYLVRVGNLECLSLVELQKGIEASSDDSIFYHTVQSLGRHDFLTEGFSNDFAQWVLAGGGAADDPEGEAVLNEVHEMAGKDLDIFVLDLPPWSALEINALQRASTIVIQNSLREGFGLTVTEALWKRKPVVASAVGGIPTQVIHNHTGLLAHSVEGTAYQVRFLLSNPNIAQRLGEQGHEDVRENFPITNNVRRYHTLLLHFLDEGRPTA